MPKCQSCGADNKADDQFCVSCGKALEGDLAGLDLLDAGIVCSNCDTYNEPNQRVCIRCKQSLAGLTGFLAAVDAPAPEDETPRKSDITQPAGTPRPPPKTTPMMPAAKPTPEPAKPAPVSPSQSPTGQMPAAVAPVKAAEACPYCRAAVPAMAQFCLACGKKIVETAAKPQAPLAQPVSIRLRLVRGFGREDTTFPVGPTGVTVGRTRALINIGNDPYLSPVHLALKLQDGRPLVEDQASHNGTFLRIRNQAELRQGAEFIVGSQRLVLLGLGGPTTDVRTPSSADTRPYGGPLPRQLFIALRSLHAGTDGKARGGAIMLRCGPVVTVGREGCDINFPLDDRMASRHLELHVRPSGLQSVEAGASNGAYVRISGPVQLQNGDEILAGEEIFRVEVG
jgi:pSer/pThr/pTyr-binding forkhead associated (FHA) protein